MNSDAKKMYLEYDCSTFLMESEGVYETYKAFNTTREQEKEWAAEKLITVIDDLRNRFNIADLVGAFRLINQIKQYENVPVLFELLQTNRGSMKDEDFSRCCVKFIKWVEKLNEHGYDGMEIIAEVKCFLE